MNCRITQKAQDTDFRQGLNIKTQEGHPMIEVSLPRPLGGDSLLTIDLTINKLSSIKTAVHAFCWQLGLSDGHFSLVIKSKQNTEAT
jgi:hypothetical protein